VNKRIQTWTSSPARFADVALRGRFARLLEQVDRCSAKPGAEEVHDLRVSIRRFSQALRVFGPMLAARPVKTMRKALHPVMEAAACVRDLDVGVERLLEEGLEEHNPVVEEMRAERRRGEMALRGRLLLLKSQEPERFWPASLHIQKVEPAPPERTGAE
jgi:CHAD domain-containing protein